MANDSESLTPDFGRVVGSLFATRMATIMFVDVTSSSALYASLGDVRAHELVAQCLLQVRNTAEEFKGEVVKTLGDGAMCSFPSPDAAVLAGMAMQERIASDATLTSPIEFHIGVNYGSVLDDDGDLFGDVVNISAYVCSLALHGQVLITSAVQAHLTPIMAKHVSPAFYAVLKGGEGDAKIYQVSWQVDGLDRTHPRLLRTPVRNTNLGALVMQWRDQEIHANFRRRRLLLGRSDAADVVIEDRAVSRFHAIVVIRRGQLYLADKSINGTFLRSGGGIEVHVLRREHILDGDGDMSLGRSLSEAPPSDIIRFRRDRRSMYRV